MQLYPIAECDYDTVVEKNSVFAAGEFILLVIGDNGSVNPHDGLIAVLFMILFYSHVLPSFFETSMFHQSVSQWKFCRTADLW